jgi:hypothetical protein
MFKKRTSKVKNQPAHERTSYERGSLDPMSTVLIVGIGYETVRLALKEGHSVRAMARSATSIRERDLKEPSRLDDRSPDRPDHRAAHGRVSRTGRCPRLALSASLF